MLCLDNYKVSLKSFKRACRRDSTSGVIRPTPIWTKIAVVVGIDPKPGHDALFWSVVTKIFEKNGGKVQIFQNPKNNIFQFSDSNVAYGKKQ